ncbi:MAG: serine/threonine protein kinase [Alphaproteobacteria bacterium]|nr:serine/threonine protein kinase [Alphaproteobacteria bacterium]
MAEGGIDVDRYRRAREIFDEVGELEPGERVDEAARRSGEDPALAALVRRLVEADLKAEAEGPATADDASGDDVSGLPERLGRFRILREIGRGGMGVVYEAEQEAPRRRVAVKTMLPLRHSRRVRAQFGTEVDALGRVLHPGIPQVYEVFETDDGVPAMAMELVEGAPLLQAVYLLDPAGRAEMLAKLCEAVDHAHRRGVIHRDLKPDNVLVTPAGQPKVLDFGIARLGEDFLPRAGTLSYLAPEQLEGAEPDVAADVYGLGAVGWEIMTGRKPVPTRSEESLPALAERKRAPLPEAPEVPDPLRAVLAQALHPEPQRRFASARSMARALREAVAPADEDDATPHPPTKAVVAVTWPVALAWFCAGAACASAAWLLAWWGVG